MNMSEPVKRRLSLDEYYALPKGERIVLRRAAFGAAVPEHLTADYDLAHLAQLLTAENEATGEFPEKWTDQVEDDCE